MRIRDASNLGICALRPYAESFPAAHTRTSNRRLDFPLRLLDQPVDIVIAQSGGNNAGP